VPVAATRAGGIGCIDLEFTKEPESLIGALLEMRRLCAGPYGVKLSVNQLAKAEALLDILAGEQPAQQNLVVLSLSSSEVDESRLRNAVDALHKRNLRVFVQAVAVNEAVLAQQCGADAVIAKGNESAGRVGEETTFVLLQHCAGKVTIPIWAQGGIGLYSAAACRVAGAAGVVLDAQLLLTRESALSAAERSKVARMDGTETICFGSRLGESFRFFAQPGSPVLESVSKEVRQLEAKLDELGLDAVRNRWCNAVSALAGDSPSKRLNQDSIWLVGQDVALAAKLSERFSTVAGIIKALRNSAHEYPKLAGKLRPLAPGSSLAQSHGTKYPIVQGAMTRVSDRAEFAFNVGDHGGLPFLALALMRGAEVEKLLSQTREKMKELPWGVGVLGFVPRELRQEQLEVILRYKPQFALIAGGRPDQAKLLEEQGIKTYLHVPSPFLLRSFIEAGSRRFIFEGRECGGHVGPRSSFILWEAMIAELLSCLKPGQDASDIHVLLAGGVHNGLSSAMAAAMVAPLVERGVQVGVLMGTAYLFTSEVVSSGAIVKKFQDAALGCERTVLFETGPGHAIRCIDSPYRTVFDQRARDLEKQQRTRDEIREELELMNLGRLRIASKGTGRGSSVAASAVPGEINIVSDEQQWSDGMYMIGQVAALHQKVLSIADLHRQVSQGATDILDWMLAAERESATVERPKNEEVAVIGMACLFPKAGDLDEYWQNIVDRVDAIGEVPFDQWDWRNLYDSDRFARDRVYSKWGGFLGEIAFDPARWGIPPSSVPFIDPMQLLLLEITRAALSDAGLDGQSLPKERTSVVLANAGHGPITADYILRSMLDWKLADLDPLLKEKYRSKLPEWTEDSFPGLLGNVAAGRIANRFDFGGINFSIDAACASSLAALYVGMNELRSGKSDVVMLAGIDTHNQPIDYLSFSKTHALSPRGRCRTFDATADGIVISEGAAVLVLKRLSDAERDGDRIYALLKGVGGSSDGRDLSLTAPRKAGQVLAIERAYQDAQVSPRSVELIEAHGTGTIVGDRTEMEALGETLENAGAEPQSCAVGSVKTMIGHTKAAAGLASLVKVAKALYHQVLPPTIGVEKPNPACKFGTGPLYINSTTRPWFKSALNRGLPRRAGVSAFGFGGTNFHVVLEEYKNSAVPAEKPASQRWPAELFLLRCSSKEQLLRRLEELNKQAQESIDRADRWQYASPSTEGKRRKSLATLAFQNYLQAANSPSDKRKDEVSPSTHLHLAIVATSLEDLKEKIARTLAAISQANAAELKDPRGIYLTNVSAQASGRVAFLFPGQGSQHVDMLADLSLQFSEVRDAIAQADQLLASRFDRNLSSFIFPPPAFEETEKKRQQTELNNTHVAQPAIAAADLGIWRLLSSLQIVPDMMGGHSFGEYVALCAAGAFSANDLIDIAEQRGRILAQSNSQRPGMMAAVSAGRDQIEQLTSAVAGVHLANVNSPNQCIIAGELSAIESAVAKLTEQGIRCREIAVSAAFHSPLMVAAQEPLGRCLAKVPMQAPTVAVYSNSDADSYLESAESVASRLVRHLVQPVQFCQEIERMYEQGARTFVEVGPNSVLTGLVEATLKGKPHSAVSMDRNGRPGLVQLLHALAELFCGAVSLDIGRLFRGRFDERAELSVIEWQKSESNGDAGQKPGMRKIYMINSSSVRAPGDKSNSALSVVSAERSDKGVKMPEKKTEHVNSGIPSGLSGADAKSKPAQLVHDDGASIPNQQAPEPAYSAVAQVSSTSIPRLQPASRSVEQVMLEFQRSMLQMTETFLTTQQNVMLAYLQSGGATTGLAAPPAELRPEMRLPVEAFRFEQASRLENQLALPKAMASAEMASVPANQIAKLEVQPAAAVSQVESLSQPTSTPVEPAVTSAMLIASLLDIVSQRTGYPHEMLDPNLDLEADLGVDSIKRIEILSGFRKLLPESKQAQIEGSMEKLAGIKTLKGIMDWIRSEFDGGSAQTSAASQPLTLSFDPVVEPAELPTEKSGAAALSTVSRGLVKVVYPPTAPVLPFAPPGVVLVIDDETGAGALIERSLKERGLTAVLVRHRPTEFQSDRQIYSGDLSAEQAVKELVAAVRAEFGPVGALIYLLGLHPDAEAEATRSLFLLAREANGDLQRMPSASAKSGRTAVFAVTSLGGEFGAGPNGVCGKSARASVTQPGVVGVLKSIAKEWPGCFCRVVDCDYAADSGEIAGQVLEELDYGDSFVEIGYANKRRLTLEVSAAPIAERKLEQSANGATPINQSSIILVTGGARGITAQICLAIAKQFKPTLVLVGRLPRPQAEDPAFAGLTSPRELKAALIEQLRRDSKEVSVSLVEQSYKRVLREREIRANLAKMVELGARVHYYSVDVRDDRAFGETVDAIYEAFGRIDGVINGAGIIEDALIKDKSLASFERVIDTKVKASLTLLNKLQLEQLRFFYLFSSVVGRTGNAGQCDYVAANEIVNKLALELDKLVPGRVASLMWGPWQAGMAPPELEAVFASHGWAMIDPERGCQAFIDELACGRKGEIEVLLVGKPVSTGQLPSPTGARMHQSAVTVEPSGEHVFRITLEPKVDLYLNDHKFDDIPVMPMAFALEMMAQAAASIYPDLKLARVHNLEIPAGIVFDTGSKQMAITIQEESRTEQQIFVRAAVTTGSAQRRTHFRATFEFVQDQSPQNIDALPEFARFPLTGTGSLPLEQSEKGLPSVEHIYREWLFHGPIFQGIVSIQAMGANGIVGEVIPSTPSQCLSVYNHESWIIDPILLDSAMQLAGVWARNYMDITVLPTGIRVLHLVSQPGDDRLSGRVFIPDKMSHNELLCNLMVCNSDGKAVLVLEGLGGIGSKTLNRLGVQGGTAKAVR
jgi:acyl transferase domain-containing protein/NAD(P)H-dependent flavin oxidoreductase YrpB (nitropropane dioxygenase family)/NADP-dependent 3-hydroxy acid dehydrogenase YdfG